MYSQMGYGLLYIVQINFVFNQETKIPPSFFSDLRFHSSFLYVPLTNGYKKIQRELINSPEHRPKSSALSRVNYTDRSSSPAGMYSTIVWVSHVCFRWLNRKCVE